MVTGGEWTSGTISWDNMPAADTLLQENISHNNLTKYQFSCLSAVQHWYDGDITGQNENYGVMIRYYDETIADYNSVFSADYTVATQRPTMTISYTPASSSVEVDKGGTKTLSVTGATGTVTWTSADPSVATVNANGVVTGVELGTTTVTASVGDMEYQTFTVSVILADGVYYISNQSSGLRLGTNGATEENTPVVQFSTSTDDYEQICRLWKITYLGDGYYSIRPMHKLNMGLHADGTVGSSVSVVNIGTSDTLGSVSNLNRWGISPKPSGDGYYIDHVGTSSLRLKSQEGAASPGLGVTTTSSANSVYSSWSLIKVTDPPNGALMLDTIANEVVSLAVRYIAVGETKSLSDFGLRPVCFSVNGNTPSDFVWTTASDKISVNHSTGEVTALSYTPDHAIVIGNCCCGTVQFEVGTVPLENGTYYFKNRHSGRYLAPFSPELSSGTTTTHTEFHGGSAQRWVLTYSGEGAYYIKPSGASTLYLGVTSSSEGANVILTNTATRWYIEPTERGAYKIIPYSGTAGGKALAVPYTETGINMGDGVLLQQLTYSNDSNLRDEWIVYSETPTYFAVVNNYYDYGYPVYFRESAAQGAQKIDMYMQMVADRYMELFGLDITARGSTYMQSCVDSCKDTISLNTIDTICTHIPSHTDRDTLLANISLNTTGSNTTSVVFWTGHRITSTSSDGEPEENRSVSWLNYILMLERVSAGNREQYSTGVLMHELNHQFGADDHYHELSDPYDKESCINKDICSRCGINPRPESCIMFYSRIDIHQDTVICDGCKEDIIAHLKKHHLY